MHREPAWDRRDAERARRSSADGAEAPPVRLKGSQKQKVTSKRERLPESPSDDNQNSGEQRKDSHDDARDGQRREAHNSCENQPDREEKHPQTACGNQSHGLTSGDGLFNTNAIGCGSSRSCLSALTTGGPTPASGYNPAVRARLWLFVACMQAACGGGTSPVQPSTPTIFPPTTIATGEYRLMLTMSTSGDPVCTGSGCVTASLCVSTGGVQPIAISVPIEVRAERTGDDVAIRPEDGSATFRMNLRISGAALSGTASGQFRSGGHVVTVDGGTPQSAATVMGTTAPVFASGSLEGAIMIGGAGCSNNGHRWSLLPRLP